MKTVYVFPPWEDRPGAYTGVGSQDTPDNVQAFMRRISRALSDKLWILRSGHAKGADQSFEAGVQESHYANWEIYLPWSGFEDLHGGSGIWCEPSGLAYDIAADHHPAWDILVRGQKRLIARDTHEVLGPDCNSPSAFLLCWTMDGATKYTTAATGGTGQAIRIANAYSVPVYNLQRDDHSTLWSEFIS